MFQHAGAEDSSCRDSISVPSTHMRHCSSSRDSNTFSTNMHVLIPTHIHLISVKVPTYGRVVAGEPLTTLLRTGKLGGGGTCL